MALWHPHASSLPPTTSVQLRFFVFDKFGVSRNSPWAACQWMHSPKNANGKWYAFAKKSCRIAWLKNSSFIEANSLELDYYKSVFTECTGLEFRSHTFPAQWSCTTYHLHFTPRMLGIGFPQWMLLGSPTLPCAKAQLAPRLQFPRAQNAQSLGYRSRMGGLGRTWLGARKEGKTEKLTYRLYRSRI